MVIFSFFFGNLAKIPSDGVPYPIFSYAGLLLWTFFSNSVGVASSSLINDARLISKIYFPRIILPIATTFVSIIDYFVASIILFAMMFYYQITLTPKIIFIIPMLFFTWMLSIGISFFFSSINVRYRDVKYVIPFFFQLLIFMTPVIYPVSVSGRFRWLLYLNPMSGYIETHRALILGNYPTDWWMLAISIILTIIIFILGMAYFKKVERHFADII
jgi:lipopolysaccharide transport system permease protein